MSNSTPLEIKDIPNSIKMKARITVKGTNITLLSQKDKDYLSLTDIARFKNKEEPGLVISHWLSNRYTVEFIGVWEQIYNPNFKVTEFRNFKNQSGSHGFALSTKQWIDKTNSIGIIAKQGRYGGTYAHKDIAFEFACLPAGRPPGSRRNLNSI